MGRVKKKSVLALLCVVLSILTIVAMMPGMAYADVKSAKVMNTSKSIKRSEGFGERIISEMFDKYNNQRKDAIKGDILIKGPDDGDYNTEHDQEYVVKQGNSYTLGLKLDVKGIKSELDDIKSSVYYKIFPKIIDVIGIRHLQCKLVAVVDIPKGLDASGNDVQEALDHLELRNNFGPYKTDGVKVHVDNTDVGDYNLSGYRFVVTSAKFQKFNNGNQRIRIVMELTIPENYNGKTYDDASQFNFACLNAIVENMPDVFTLEIPGIKADADQKIGKMKIEGQMGADDQSECYMSAGLGYNSGKEFKTNWYATQLDGGQDANALNSNGISLTAVRKAAVQYDANGGKGTMAPTEGNLQDQVQAAKNQFTRSGYSFNGWNTKADGSGTAYKRGDSVPLNDETVTLYAQWTENSTPVTPVIPDTPVIPSEPEQPQKHEVTIHEDNPTADKPETTTKITVDDRGKVEKPAQDPVRPGYTFDGWYSDPECTIPFDFSKPVTGDLHIYAKWNKNVKPQTAKKVTGILLPKAIANGSSHQTVTWTPLTNVDGYYVYEANCNTPKKTYRFKKVADVKASAPRVYKQSGLKKGVAYKYYVAAYQMKNGKKKVVKKSLSVHSIAGNLMRKRVSYTNVKKVSVNKNAVTLNVGKTYRIQPSVKGVYSNCAILQKGHAAMFRYVYIKDGKNISVSSTGIVRAKKAGKCNVYVLGTNGVRAKVAVTVK